ncbi:cytochrome c [Allostella sp. ATCC 35155]|nr:cytochrome c [Stella sp. ATCC 35155]
MTGRGLVVAGLTIVAGGLAAAALFVWSGIYNVSASRQHLDVTTWILDTLRRHSVRTHSLGIAAPPLDAPGLVRLGAVHYDLACAACHGAPGRPASALADAMLPTPPPLGPAVREWSPEELSWIVLNGQKYTGMPAWVAPRRGDEVWAVVAFLRRLPQIDAAEYRRLAGLPTQSSTVRAPGIGVATDAEPMAMCRRCHGPSGARTVGPLVPPLAGQPVRYLARALSEYADGTRPSGIMQFAARGLDAAAVGRLARAFAAKASSTPSHEPDPTDPGSRIAHEGIPERGIPPCLTCHSGEADPRFPRLAGFSATYLERQLRLWRDDVRGRSGYAAIMRPIARRLDPGEAASVAAYLARLAPAGAEGGGAP